jgi:hypothetical protein
MRYRNETRGPGRDNPALEERGQFLDCERIVYSGVGCLITKEK